MLQPKDFVEFLQRKGITFFAGVPDSLLKDLIACIDDQITFNNHVTAANEGAAVAIATGHHLATGGIAAVYMQNSGLGNAINPLVSLVDPKVYSIPVLLVIGWRGEPGIPDEPQHLKQGEMTEELLRTLGIACFVLSPGDTNDSASRKIEELVSKAREGSCATALLVRAGTFEKYLSQKPKITHGSMTREEAIQTVVSVVEDNAIVVSTTGKISRELYEARTQHPDNKKNDFLTVGSMGHSSQIALGLAIEKKDRSVYCFDGDGSVIMHMGSLATVGWMAPQNFKHIIFNNLAHESVGGQPSAARIIDFPAVAKACGYLSAVSVETKENLVQAMQELREAKGPALLEIKVSLQSRENLGRPKEKPVENKKSFMDFVK